MQPINKEQLLYHTRTDTVAECAKVLGVDRGTVYRYIKEHQMPDIKYFNMIRQPISYTDHQPLVYLGETMNEYQVTRDGKVFSVPRNSYMSTERYVNINIQGEIVRVPTGLAVASTYIPNPKHYKFVQHINGDTTDHRVENLKWVENESQIIRNVYSNATSVTVNGVAYKSMRECERATSVQRETIRRALEHIDKYNEPYAYYRNKELITITR